MSQSEYDRLSLFSPTRFGFVHLICDPSINLADTQFIFTGELTKYHYVSLSQSAIYIIDSEIQICYILIAILIS